MLKIMEKQTLMIISIAISHMTCGRLEGINMKNQGGEKYTPESTPNCKAEEVSNHTAEYHRRREVNLRLLNQITYDGVPEDWDGTFPSGPTEDYKHLVEKGHKIEKEHVVFPRLSKFIFYDLHFSDELKTLNI